MGGNAITEVMLTKTQFRDFQKLISNVSMSLSIEDSNITLDLSNIETMIQAQTQEIKAFKTQSEDKQDQIVSQLSVIATDVISGLQSIQEAIQAQTLALNDGFNTLAQTNADGFSVLHDLIRNQTEQQHTDHQNWLDKWDSVVGPISATLNTVANTINIIKDVQDLVKSIQEAFYGTQADYNSMMQTNIAQITTSVEAIAGEFGVGMRAIVAEALSGSTIEVASDSCATLDGLFCEYISPEPPLPGSLACGKTDTEICTLSGVAVFPAKKGSDTSDSVQTEEPNK